MDELLAHEGPSENAISSDRYFSVQLSRQLRLPEIPPPVFNFLSLIWQDI